MARSPSTSKAIFPSPLEMVVKGPKPAVEVFQPITFKLQSNPNLLKGEVLVSVDGIVTMYLVSNFRIARVVDVVRSRVASLLLLPP